MTHKNNQKPKKTIKTPKTLWGVPKSPSDSLGGRKIPKDSLIIIIIKPLLIPFYRALPARCLVFKILVPPGLGGPAQVGPTL